jgi:hypothetical protein
LVARAAWNQSRARDFSIMAIKMSVRIVGKYKDCGTIHLPRTCQHGEIRPPASELTISDSKEYDNGLIYEIHLNHGCIEVGGITSSIDFYSAIYRGRLKGREAYSRCT